MGADETDVDILSEKPGRSERRVSFSVPAHKEILVF